MKRILIFIIVLWVNNLFAQNKGDEVVIGVYDIIHSEVLNEDRLLLINLPENYKVTKLDYPVVYLFYGDRVMQYFAPTITEINRLSSDGFMPEMIVVGIGNTDRYGNFLPNNRDGKNPGADNFLVFLETELFPYIENNYRIKDSRIFIAPQASSTFSLNALFINSDLYDACFMNNPFRWPYNRDYLMKMSREYLDSNTQLKNYIYSSFSINDELDKVGLEYIREWQKLIDSLELTNFKVEINFQDKSNDFVSSLELKTGFKSYFKDYLFPDDLKVENLSSIQAYYLSLSEIYGFVPDEPDLILTLESDKLRNKGKIKESKEILNYILTKYPESLNAWWRLANIYREEGDTVRALEFYKKCVEINLDMAPAKRWIETLEK